MVDSSEGKRVLALVPQRPPFRFIDEILALEGPSILGRYRFREDEYFYAGHFPGRPITPGVILVEAMAQTGLVALGIALMLREGIPSEKIEKMAFLFALADGVQFDRAVYPGETILIKGRNLLFRRGTIRSEVEVWTEEDEAVCRGVLTGRASGVIGGKDA